MSNITLYKERTINYDKQVQIYRNLSNKDFLWSIRQNGKIVGHSNAISLTVGIFHVNHGIQQKVRETKRKRVHAWVRGFLEKSSRFIPKDAVQIVYDPYTHWQFMDTRTGCEVFYRHRVVFKRKKVLASKA